MKLYKSLLAALALAVSSVALTSCDEDLAVPPLSIPQSDWKANTTIADFKAKYWSNEDSYYKEVGKNEAGEDIILGGRIIANDITGNIYKYVVLQDETGAVIVAANVSDLHLKYKVGEEMYVNVTGLCAGKTSGLFEIGGASSYTSGSETKPQIGQMTEDAFNAHVQINGLPKPEEVNVLTMTIPELNAMKGNVADIQKYQSQLVKLENVSFKGGGEELWASQGTSHNSRYLYDESGASILVDNSGYSDFNDQVLPAGNGDVIVVLNYYRESWQLVFRTNEDCFNFGGESYAPETPAATGDGTADAPYSVGAVIGGASGSNVWVTGYIVGWIDGMSMADGAKFTAPASVNSNILLASKPDEKVIANCIPIALPNGTSARTDLNLKDHAANLGKQVSLLGNLTKYFGADGVKEVSVYKWGDKGGEPDTPEPQPGDGTGTSDKPYTAAQIISGAATGTGVWFTGYIVGAINDKSIDNAAFSGPFALDTNILIAEKAGETDITKCVPVQLPSGAVRTALNLKDNESNLGKQVTIKGDPLTYFGAKGFKNTSAYSWGATGTGGGSVESGVQFKKVTSITSGKEYIIVAEGKAAVPNTANYGYIKVTDVTDNGGIITTDAANAFTITASDSNYKIIMSDGRYLYQTGSYNSFNFSATAIDGDTWSIEVQSDGTFKITNLSVNKFIQFDTQYTSYGSYSDSRGVLPSLYEKVN